MEIDLGDLSFYWRAAETNQPEKDIPVHLPYVLSFDEKHGLFKQKPNIKTYEALELAYSKGYNIGYLQEGHSLVDGYGNSFMNFLKSQLTEDNQDVLEIGCGACAILKQLKESGHNVFGIDPSPIAEEAAKKNGISFIKKFYNEDSLAEKYDAIYHHNVLEHVFEPEEFINNNTNNLKNKGKLIVAVPDCTDSIENGDLSMIWHEHISYFDHESLGLLLESCGLTNIKVQASTYGGLIYASGQKIESESIYKAKDNSDKFIMYKNKFKKNARNILNHTKESLDNQKILGVYIPLRFINYLSYFNLPKSQVNRIRFFDDDLGSQGKYYDGYDIKIESFDQLANNPPDTVFIFSYKFGRKIKSRIKGLGVKSIKVMTIMDLIETTAEKK